MPCGAGGSRSHNTPSGQQPQRQMASPAAPARRTRHSPPSHSSLLPRCLSRGVVGAEERPAGLNRTRQGHEEFGVGVVTLDPRRRPSAPRRDAAAAEADPRAPSQARGEQRATLPAETRRPTTAGEEVDAVASSPGRGHRSRGRSTKIPCGRVIVISPIEAIPARPPVRRRRVATFVGADRDIEIGQAQRGTCRAASAATGERPAPG